jgi:ferric-dicitrate binding protein FerR (iron transport regulator)
MQADRFEPLLDRYLAGEATSEEGAELEAILRDEPEKRRRLVERSILETHLHKAFSGIVPLSSKAPPASRRFRRVALFATAAALLIAVGIVVLAHVSRNDSPVLEVVKGKTTVDGVVVERIQAGTWFEVSADASALIRLSDGSQAELDRSSRAAIRGQPGEARQEVELSAGGGVFRVTHGGGLFRVRTPVGTVTALGTEFTVKLNSRARPTLAVEVHEGKVRVEVNGKSHVLTAGKARNYDEDGEHNDHDDGQQNNHKDDRNQRDRKNQREDR